jgi:cytochrome c-550 PedF
MSSTMLPGKLMARRLQRKQHGLRQMLTNRSCAWSRQSPQEIPLFRTFSQSLPVARVGVAAALVLGVTLAHAHGDVTPQAVDTKDLPAVGANWRADNPYRGNAKAITVGASAYNQNCARCHGLEAISGGIAPDLRKLDGDCAGLKDAQKKTACVSEMDTYYAGKVRRGVTRNGAVYMPPFEGVLNQEAVWAIKSYLETRREKPL